MASLWLSTGSAGEAKEELGVGATRQQDEAMPKGGRAPASKPGGWQLQGGKRGCAMSTLHRRMQALRGAHWRMQGWSIWLWGWSLAFIAAGTVMFPNFYPWT